MNYQLLSAKAAKKDVFKSHFDTRLEHLSYFFALLITSTVIFTLHLQSNIIFAVEQLNK